MNLTNLLKPLAYLFVLLVVVALLPASAAAWGNKGHMIIARIANERLSAPAREAVGQLLREETFEDASVWADMIKTSRRETAYWHYVDIPLSRDRYLAVDCKKGCIIKALEQQIQTLRDPNKDATARGDALRYVIHLIGDLHQPFHTTTNTNPNDSAGNRVKVFSIKGRLTNLHSIWDDDLIDSAMGESRISLQAYASELGKMARRNQTTISTRGAVTEWALESHKLAWEAYRPDEQKYFMINDGKIWKLGDYYYKQNRPVMEKQLMRAGVRLAQILNDAFGGRAGS